MTEATVCRRLSVARRIQTWEGVVHSGGLEEGHLDAGDTHARERALERQRQPSKDGVSFSGDDATFAPSFSSHVDEEESTGLLGTEAPQKDDLDGDEWCDTDSENGDYTWNCPLSPLSRHHKGRWDHRTSSAAHGEQQRQRQRQQQQLQQLQQQQLQRGVQTRQPSKGGVSSNGDNATFAPSFSSRMVEEESTALPGTEAPQKDDLNGDEWCDTDSENGDYTWNCPLSPLSRHNKGRWDHLISADQGEPETAGLRSRSARSSVLSTATPSDSLHGAGEPRTATETQPWKGNFFNLMEMFGAADIPSKSADRAASHHASPSALPDLAVPPSNHSSPVAEAPVCTASWATPSKSVDRVASHQASLSALPNLAAPTWNHSSAVAEAPGCTASWGRSSLEASAPAQYPRPSLAPPPQVCSWAPPGILHQGYPIGASVPPMTPSTRKEDKHRAKIAKPASKADWSGNVTTVMVRNLPVSLRQQEFMVELDSSGFEGTYDFCYLPRNFSSGQSRGYAFVNFTEAGHASRFRRLWHQTERFSCIQPKVDVSPAHIQGYEANVAMANAAHVCKIRNPGFRRLVLPKEEGGHMELHSPPSSNASMAMPGSPPSASGWGSPDSKAAFSTTGYNLPPAPVPLATPAPAQQVVRRTTGADDLAPQDLILSTSNLHSPSVTHSPMCPPPPTRPNLNLVTGFSFAGGTSGGAAHIPRQLPVSCTPYFGHVAAR